MKFYKMLLALLLATTAMCFCTENSFAAELIQEPAAPGVLLDTADTLNTIPTINTVPVLDTTIPATDIELPVVPATAEDIAIADSALIPDTDTTLIPEIDPALLQAYELQAAQLLAYQQMLAATGENALVADTTNVPTAKADKNKSKNAKKTKKLTDLFKKDKEQDNLEAEEEIELPETDELAELAAMTEANSQFSKDDVMLVAKLISHEAKGQSPDGWAAVAEVVVNRINTPLYPNTVYDVIYQRGQFSHSRGIKKENPTVGMILIADLVLNYNYRVLNDPAIVNFRNPKKTNGLSANIKKNWGALEYITCIDDHAFYANRYIATNDDVPEDIKHNMFMALKKNFSNNS